MKKRLTLLSIIITTLIACEKNIEINFGEQQLPENQVLFQVDFDNQTYIADYVSASIVNGITILKATKTSTKEVIVISLNNDEIGEYTLSPNNEIGAVAYKKDTDDTFNTSPTAFSGRIDLNNIDYLNNKLFGAFSFIGTRTIPLLNDQGQPILDADNNIIYTEEIKNFSNGLFKNINFSITEAINPNIEPETTPDNNTFFMKIDGDEFVETTLNAEKIIVDGVDVIQLKATNNGSNNILKLQFPANVVLGSSHVLQTSTTNPASESIATFRDISLSQEFGAYSGAISAPTLQIISHDMNTNKIVATFEFSGQHGTLTKEFSEGAFSVFYTE